MGLEYAENDWILWEGQERSSLAFRYAIDHSPLTTWRLVKPRGAGGGVETSKSRPNERKIFFLLNDSRKEKRNSTIIYKKKRAKWDVSHHIKCKDVELSCFLMAVNESFYTAMHDILYFLTDGNIWIPYKACHVVLFIRLCHVCFFPRLAPPAWPTLTVSRLKKRCDFKQLRWPLCANFFTPTVLDYSDTCFQWSKRDYLSR